DTLESGFKSSALLASATVSCSHCSDLYSYYQSIGSVLIMFWTLYIVISVGGLVDATYVGIESFSSRVQCEAAIGSRVVEVDNAYKFQFKCLKTDEIVK
ncbi:MAG: hypothetical protein P8N61_01485, partial [Porticoccaceae bacterium]|nr:hypothetical protein [Porticoccaceae bacterium]